jgi:hypothetical protein
VPQSPFGMASRIGSGSYRDRLIHAHRAQQPGHGRLRVRQTPPCFFMARPPAPGS